MSDKLVSSDQKWRPRLERAIASQKLVRIKRDQVEPWPFDAFVLDISARWLLMQPVRDRIDLDGYDAIRINDITSVTRCSKAAFYGKVLAHREQHPTRPEGISIATTRELLKTAVRSFGLVIINREFVTPDSCEIGQVKSFLDGGRYTLRWVNTVGKWEKDTSRYRLSDISRIQFGGGYERALAIVALGSNDE